jgi:hypothetical protein
MKNLSQTVAGLPASVLTGHHPEKRRSVIPVSQLVWCEPRKRLCGHPLQTHIHNNACISSLKTENSSKDIWTHSVQRGVENQVQ